MAINPANWSHVLTIPESYTPSAATSGQTLVITESVIAKLPAGDQTTFWSNVQNEGGDVRICTDSEGVNQLPVEIVSLDNSAQTCVIWTRKPSYNGTGDLYLFIGKAGETQPPVTDPFGRNAVWADFEIVIHEGQAEDSTGNHVVSLNGSPSLSNGVFGQGFDIQSAGEYLSVPDSAGSTFAGKDYSVDIWTVIPSNSGNPAQMLLDKSFSDNAKEVRLFKQNGGSTRHRTPELSGSNLDTAAQYGTTRDSFTFISGTKRTLANDTQRGISAASGSITRDSNAIVIGSDLRNGANFPLAGVISEVWVQFVDIRSDEARTTEYANQNDPATFFGTPTLATTGGAAGVTADAAYTIPAPTFSANASVTLPAPIADTIFTVNAPTVNGNASATIPGFSASVSFTVSAPSISSSASATLPNPSAGVSYTVSAPTFSVNADASLPQPISDLAFTVNTPTVAANATATETGFNASVNFTVNAPTFAVDTNATLPQPESTVSFAVSPPSVSAVAIVGGIAIIVDDETNINQRVLSTNINAPILSNNING